ncbi:MAG: hypothetical protein WC941_09005 [Candidatus Bathyarchaeia archaeon]
MSSTITLRLPRELKDKMRRHPRPWSEELRNYIEQRIHSLELIEALDQIETRAKTRPTPDSTPLIREDRKR